MGGVVLVWEGWCQCWRGGFSVGGVVSVWEGWC